MQFGSTIMITETPRSPTNTSVSGSGIETLDIVLSRLADSTLIAIGILAVPVLITSLARVFDVGWQESMSLQIGLCALVWATAILRRRCPFRFRISVIFSVLFLAGFGGFLSFGLVSAGKTLLVLTGILVTIFFGTRAGITAIAICCAILASIAFGVYHGVIQYDIDFNAYTVRPASWIAEIVSFTLWTGMATACLGGLRGTLIRSINALGERTSELECTNRQLSEEITQRKQSEERFRELAENVQDVFWLWSPDWRQVYYVSPAYEKLWGRSCRQLYEKPFSWLENIVEEDRQQVLEMIRARRPNDPSLVVFPEHRIGRPDGSTRWISARGFPVQDERGNTVRITGIATDITNRKWAEQELRDTKALLQAALDHSQAGIAIADAPDGRLSYINQAGLRILGKTESEVMCDIDDKEYVSSWRILHFDGTPFKEDEVPLVRAIRHGETCSQEFIIRRSENEDRIVWANAAPILDHAGELLAGIVVFLDMTDRKRMEELLRATLEATADGILVVDAKGAVLHRNARFAETWRIPRDLLDAGDDSKLLAFVAEQLEDPARFQAKIFALNQTLKEDLDTFRFKDGRVFESFSRPLLHGDQIGGRVWSFTDVTQHK